MEDSPRAGWTGVPLGKGRVGYWQMLAAACLFAHAAVPAEARTLAEIRASATLRICVAGSSTDLYQANGEAFARFLGVQPEVRKLASFDQQFHNAQGVTVRDKEYESQLLADGSCDVFPNDLHVLDWRETKMLIVRYYTVRNGVVAHQDLASRLKSVADLGGLRAAVQKGTNYDDWLLRANASALADNPVTITYATTAESMRLVSAHKADFTVVGIEGAFKWVREGPGLVLLFPVDDAIQVGWGVKPGDRQLAKELERFFSESNRAGSVLDQNWRRFYNISFKEYQQFAVSFGAGKFDLDKFLAWALPALGGLAIVIAAILLWNRRLKREVSERQAAEEALRKAHAQLAEREAFTRALHESSPSGLALVTDSGEIRHLTPNWRGMLGYKTDDPVPPQSTSVWAEPAERQTFLELLERSGQVRNFEAKFLRKSGEPLPVLLNASHVVVGGERLIASWAHDISELKAAELGLKEALDRQEAIFGASPYGIAVYQQRRCVIASPSFERIFGYATGEFRGKGARVLFRSDDEFEWIGRELYATVVRGETYQYETQSVRKDGTLFWCRVSAALLPGQEAVRGIVALYEDVSARRAAEEALRSANAEQDAIFESASAGIALVRDGRIDRCNHRLEAIFGYGDGEVSGMALTEFMGLPQEERAETTARAREQLARGETYRRERLMRRKDGSTFWCRLSGHAVEAADLGKGTVWMLEDVTEEHAAAEALREAKRVAEEATRAKSMFLATMSHEIRTPMNGVLGLLQLLGFGKLDPEQKATLDGARDSAKSLLRIIDDLLDFSKIEAGKLEIRPETASIAAVVESVRQVYSGVASGKDLNFGTSVDERISPALKVDPLRLRQILNNFVSNAIKFTQKGGVEIVADLLERKGDRDVVRFSVIDTGIGIPPEAQARLFQAYAQASADTARHFGGTGLGLTICRRLAEMMEGDIAMQSEPGKGTTMMLTLSLPIGETKDLPRADPTGAAAAAMVASRRRAPTIEEARKEGTLILIAEDHPTNRSVLVRLLGLLGYAAETAENGKLALEKWKRGGFALVLTDCNMPEMDGYELAQAIRASEDGGTRVPIIACTANALAGEADRCIAAGMDDFVAKPVELEALAHAMERWLPIAGAAKGPAPQAAGAAAGNGAPLDRSSLAQISGGDAAAEREILAEFRAANDADMVALRAALIARDIEQVTKASHRVKGACKMVGALALALVCERMEKAGRKSSWKDIAIEQGALEQEFERLNRWLEAN